MSSWLFEAIPKHKREEGERIEMLVNSCMREVDNKWRKVSI